MMSSETKSTGSSKSPEARKPVEPQQLEGKFVSVTGKELTMSNADNRKFNFTLAEDVQLTCDGNKCQADQLHAGNRIRVTTKADDRSVATSIEAIEKEIKFLGR